MTSVVAKARLRLIGMNPSNTAGNEVEGTATGGIEKIVAAEGKKVGADGTKKVVVCCSQHAREGTVAPVWAFVVEERGKVGTGGRMSEMNGHRSCPGFLRESRHAYLIEEGRRTARGGRRSRL